MVLWRGRQRVPGSACDQRHDDDRPPQVVPEVQAIQEMESEAFAVSASAAMVDG